MPSRAQRLAPTYDDASNVTSVTDKTTGEVAAYTYDQLNCLGGNMTTLPPVPAIPDIAY
ncbi:MAG: hypothetical protein ACYC9X_04685 [Dehalococcoidia bacterium]